MLVQNIGNSLIVLDIAGKQYNIVPGLKVKIDDIYVEEVTRESQYFNSNQEVLRVTYGESAPPPSILSYGADSSGSTSSNDAILNSISSLGFAYVPPGTFTVSDLELTSGVIYGQGTLIKETNADNALILNGPNIQISGITFNSTTDTSNATSEIILKSNADSISIFNCKFNGTLNAAITGDPSGTSNAKRIDIRDNSFLGSYQNHVHLYFVDYVKITSNFLSNSILDSIKIQEEVDECIITNNHFKNIGNPTTIVQRPDNWSATVAYVSGDIVSVSPYGVYQCVVPNSTVGANPSTTGLSQWTLIDSTYFSSKDAIDTYFSGKNLVISGNIVDQTECVGFDIKGVDPNGTYRTSKIIVSNNVIKKTFGRGIFLSNANLVNNTDFLYVGEMLISNNVVEECNRERYDYAESAIYLRQGSRNVIITNNIVRKNYAIGISVRNLDETAKITQNVSILGNQVISNGLPGNPGNLGMNLSPVDSLNVSNNIITNEDLYPEYRMTFNILNAANGTLTIPTVLDTLSLTLDYQSTDTVNDIATALIAELNAKYFDAGSNISYFDNEAIDQGIHSFGVDSTGQLTFSAAQSGSQYDILSVTINPSPSGNLYPQASDFVLDGNNLLTITVRTSTKPYHLITGWANAPSAVTALYSTPTLTSGTSASSASQAVLAADTIEFSGGTAPAVVFDSRLPNLFNGNFSYSDANLSVSIEQRDGSNSVQRYAMNYIDREIVGATTFQTPFQSSIISGNHCAGNNSDPRYNVLVNYLQAPALIAYVSSDNTGNSTALTTLARTAFSGGADSNASNQLNTQATLITQSITLKAIDFGAIGNSNHFTISQQTGANQPARVTIAPYIYGGREIILGLPTDGSGNPLALSISDGEALLKTSLGQGLLTFRDNYLGRNL